MILSDHHEIKSAPKLQNLVPPALFFVALQLLSLRVLFLCQLLPVLTSHPLPTFSEPLLLDYFSQLLPLLTFSRLPPWLFFSHLLRLLLTTVMLLVIV